jgi:cardiolipin synthase
MKITLLVDSDEFWQRLKADIAAAKDTIYMQTLSFEGDRVGQLLSDALLSSEAEDIKIVIDYWTRHVLSQKVVYSPRNLFNRRLHQEAAETKRLVQILTKEGIQVKFVNPYGPLMLKMANRNHKKLVVLDNHIVYIGGINFSEHNFSWHDMMLRIENPAIAHVIANDFLATWDGKNRNSSYDFKGFHFHIFDGYTNETAFNKIFALMEKAKTSIVIESAYITFPFYERLRAIREKGVAVTIIAPEANNRPIFNGYTRWESVRSGFDLRLYQGRMTHLKLMLIDDNCLLVGSANFDYLSYHSQQELIAVITDLKIISQVKERVIETDLKQSIRYSGKSHRIKGCISVFLLNFFLRLSVFLGNFRKVC